MTREIKYMAFFFFIASKLGSFAGLGCEKIPAKMSVNGGNEKVTMLFKGTQTTVEEIWFSLLP